RGRCDATSSLLEPAGASAEPAGGLGLVASPFARFAAAERGLSETLTGVNLYHRGPSDEWRTRRSRCCEARAAALALRAAATDAGLALGQRLVDGNCAGRSDLPGKKADIRAPLSARKIHAEPK